MLGAASVLYVGAWGALPLLDKVALRRLAPLQLLWGTFTVAYAALTFVFVFLSAADTEKKNGGATVLGTFRAASGVVFLTGALTALGYLAYVFLLSRVEVHRMALIAPMVPVLTLVLSVVILRERMTWVQAAGAATVVLGLFLFYSRDIRDLAPGPGA